MYKNIFITLMLLLILSIPICAMASPADEIYINGEKVESDGPL